MEITNRKKLMCDEKIIEKIDKAEAMIIDKKRIIAGVIIALVMMIATTYTTTIIAVGKIDQKLVDHVQDPDVHMRLLDKLNTFVTRPEYETLAKKLDEANRKLDDLNSYLRDNRK